jgi:hypothetical protein
MSPPLLIVRTLTLSDCQFLHVAMTFCALPSEKVPVAVVCAVSPLDFISSALTDNVTDCNVCEPDVGSGVGVDVEGPVGDDDVLSQPAMETATAKTKRTRFMERLRDATLIRNNRRAGEHCNSGRRLMVMPTITGGRPSRELGQAP